MSLLSAAMSQGQKKSIQMISVKDIRINKGNFYDIEDENIKQLADLLLKNGVNNGRVYYEDLGDGRHYTLIGGEQRYRALCYLYEQGKHDGLYNVLVSKKPKDKDEETLLIIEDNFQRTKSIEDRKKEIERLSVIYDKFKAADKELDIKMKAEDLSEEQRQQLEDNRNIPKGMLKRDWIQSKIGISGRQIQEYLTGNLSHELQEKKEKSSDKPKDPEPAYQNIKSYMQDKLGTKVSFAKNKFSVSFTNKTDLKRILEILDCAEITKELK